MKSGGGAEIGEVHSCTAQTEEIRTGSCLERFQDCCSVQETAGPSTPLLIPFGNEKLRSG